MDIASRKGENPFDEPVRILRDSEPEEVASRAGARWLGSGPGAGEMSLPVLCGEVTVRFPDVEVDASPPVSSFSLKLLSVIYLSTTDGTAPSGDWLAYRDLPGGRFYEPVVRRSVEEPLAHAFGEDPGRFREACAAWGGAEEHFGDASCSFSLFPNVRLIIILWRRDDEFPARVQALFDSNSTHHLNAFDLRMGAQEVSSRLIKELKGEGG